MVLLATQRRPRGQRRILLHRSELSRVSVRGRGTPRRRESRVCRPTSADPLGLAPQTALTSRSSRSGAWCAPLRRVRLVSSGVHVLYTISLDASGKPLSYAAPPISAELETAAVGPEPANLGQLNPAMRLGRAADRVPLMRDAVGNQFPLFELFLGDSTATNRCDPGVGARIVELEPSGREIRSPRRPGQSASIASCPAGSVQRYQRLDSLRPPRPTYPGLRYRSRYVHREWRSLLRRAGWTRGLGGSR